ncbi:hypothetical protein [Neptunitalea lumnitzerae]|uniref:Uncharacterized protein n=1 Tax=Neptunitalea lumnitzerae TaxID=2965509 RepID=A0ABQ5MF88_9FLAO|nr:hypothetical protein [Neptunitalea sp. Y10]GLB48076.1 hypothetical protein Y10_04440 [Neptunitalea sp. Y10]
MKKILLLLLVASSCQLTHTPKTYKRNTYVFSSATTYKELHYTFTVTEKEDMLQYKYTCKEFADRGISFSYNEEKDALSWLGSFYKANEGVEISLPELSDKPFKLYDDVEGAVDGAGPLAFNPEYGLLLLYNTNGPIMAFTKGANARLAKELFTYYTLLNR